MAIQKITSGILADGAIVAADIANGSITTAKIADGNVTSAKIDTVANTKITGLVTASQIANVANTQVTGSIEATQVGTTVSQLFGMRNRIINGAMEIDQRNAGAAVTANLSYPVDRFQISNGTDGTFSAQQSTSIVPVGFTHSVGITITAEDTSLGATQALTCVQRIEGYNVSDLAWGTANAKTVTISFWVRSSLTGTFGGSLRNSAANRSYPFTYTISSANTWEQKSITIAGDTSGTWLIDSGVGITLAFGLGAGVDRSGTAGAWNSNNNASATGATNVVATNGATFYITGVQLEVGSTATPFERRMYGTELALCQRYYQQWGKSSNVAYRPYGVGSWVSSTRARIITPTFLPMRTTPSFTYNNPTNASIRLGSTAAAATAITLDIASPEAIMYNVDVTSGGTEGRGTMLFQNDTNSTSLELSAEF